jgi:hypothetical protein
LGCKRWPDLEDQFDLDWHSERYAGNAEDDAGWEAGGAEHVEQQLRRSIGDLGMFMEIGGAGDIDAQLRDRSDSVQRS